MDLFTKYRSSLILFCGLCFLLLSCCLCCCLCCICRLCRLCCCLCCLCRRYLCCCLCRRYLCCCLCRRYLLCFFHLFPFVGETLCLKFIEVKQERIKLIVVALFLLFVANGRKLVNFYLIFIEIFYLLSNTKIGVVVRQVLNNKITDGLMGAAVGTRGSMT